jgi:hypothetical protein
MKSVLRVQRRLNRGGSIAIGVSGNPAQYKYSMAFQREVHLPQSTAQHTASFGDFVASSGPSANVAPCSDGSQTPMPRQTAHLMSMPLLK